MFHGFYLDIFNRCEIRAVTSKALCVTTHDLGLSSTNVLGNYHDICNLLIEKVYKKKYMETKGSSSGHAYWSGMEILGERQLLPRRRAACRVWPRRVSDTYQISKRKFDIVVELCWKCLKVFGFSGKLTSFTRQLFYFCDLFIFCSIVI